MTYTELLKSEGRVFSISLHLVVILRLILYSLRGKDSRQKDLA